MGTNGNRDGRKRGGGVAPPAAARAHLRDFSRSLPMSLLKAREAVMRSFRPHLTHFAMTEQQWRVLRALSAVETIEILALAEATFLLPPSLSRILKDLDERGLIVRTTSEEDMRRGLVAISGRGRKLIEQAGAYSEAIYAEITRRYGAKKLALLQRMLGDLETALADPIEGRIPPSPSRQRRRSRKATTASTDSARTFAAARK